MRAYGIPRLLDTEWPDMVDSKRYGSKSSDMNCRGAGEDIRSAHRSSKSKRRIRRYWKRVARAVGKEKCINY